MTFDEFLSAMQEDKLLKLLNSKDWKLISLFKEQFTHLLRQYYFVGGMPAVVFSYCKEKDLKRVRELQNNILSSYDQDFSKHAPTADVPRIRMVWNAIPAQLAKENKKFIYGLLKEGARAKEFELAIEWLTDCGLLGALVFAPPSLMLIENKIFSEFKGMFTELYVLEQLITDPQMSIYYWSSDRSDGELDFIVQHDTQIWPIEVKAEENLHAKSLRSFISRHPEMKGLRLSMSDFREEEWMTNIPLYTLPLHLDLF